MREVVRSLLAYLIALLMGSLLWWLLSPASAHAAAPQAIKEISYPTLFGVVAAGLFVAKAVEQLLSKAGLLKSDKEKQIKEIHDWIFDRKEGAAVQIDDLHGWHKPVETAGGTKFSWKDSGEHAATHHEQLDRIEESLLAIGKVALGVQHRQDVMAEDLERLKS